MSNEHIATSYNMQLSIRLLEQSARYHGANLNRHDLILSYVPG